MSLLVVAGEGSGDALAAPVLTCVGARAFGLGGPALAAAGLDSVSDLRTFAAMGLAPVARRGARFATALLRLVHAIRKREPKAALLVGFSEPNAWLARWLHGRGVRTLWYAPPQVWAWRTRRAVALAAACEHLALTLPFEESWWRRAGASATYVGHPAAELPLLPRARGGAPEIALLPGSREQEVRAHLPVMLAAAQRLGLSARVVVAPALSREARSWLVRGALAARATVTSEPLPLALRDAAVAIVCSGTATLECAALGVPPVIVYRTDPFTFAVARRLVHVPHVGLPNLVLGRPAFPELLQREASTEGITAKVLSVLGGLDSARNACNELREALQGNVSRPPAETVAEILRPWLS